MDQDLRSAARAAENGGPEEQAAYLRNLVRSGELPRAFLEVYASLGNATAALALGTAPSRDRLPSLCSDPDQGLAYVHRTGSLCVYIPAGAGFLGNDAEGAFDDERPRELCTFAQAAWITQVAISMPQWLEFLAASGYAPEGAVGPLAEGDPRSAAVGLSWQDTQTYCAWAGMQLPHENLWEYAARGWDGRLYPWGNNWIESRAERAKQDSPFGLKIICGEAWQWCGNEYRADRWADTGPAKVAYPPFVELLTAHPAAQVDLLALAHQVRLCRVQPFRSDAARPTDPLALVAGSTVEPPLIGTMLWNQAPLRPGAQSVEPFRQYRGPGISDLPAAASGFPQAPSVRGAEREVDAEVTVEPFRTGVVWESRGDDEISSGFGLSTLLAPDRSNAAEINVRTFRAGVGNQPSVLPLRQDEQSDCPTFAHGEPVALSPSEEGHFSERGHTSHDVRPFRTGVVGGVPGEEGSLIVLPFGKGARGLSYVRIVRFRSNGQFALPFRGATNGGDGMGAPLSMRNC